MNEGSNISWSDVGGNRGCNVMLVTLVFLDRCEGERDIIQDTVMCVANGRWIHIRS